MKSIIMAGGSGTRLWPLSRSKYPKQFLKLKNTERSLFQMTVERCRNFCSLRDIYVLTVRDYEFIIRLQIEELGYTYADMRVLLEPRSKNTLPAIYNAVKAIREQGDDTVVVMPSDHLIRDASDLFERVREGAPLTTRYIYSFGVRPTCPETGFGYIMPGESIAAGSRIREFKEKPDLETAKRYVDDGYFWNSGMFMFHTELFTREVRNLAPDVYAAFELPDPDERFDKTPSISIDYGIMEKSAYTAVMPLRIDWDDLGSFATFYETYASNKDADGNVGFGDDIMIGSSGNLAYIEDDGKTCALIGVHDLVVVDQGDALLICDKDNTQNVKGVVDALKSRNDPRADVHLTEYRPWGSFTILENGQFYKIKRLSVLTGKQLSYQMHYHRSEHWVVVSGTATVTLDGEDSLVHSGENIFVPAGARHRLRNDGRLLLEVIEVQSGQYLGEDDIVRFEDDFGRAGTGAGR